MSDFSGSVNPILESLQSIEPQDFLALESLLQVTQTIPQICHNLTTTCQNGSDNDWIDALEFDSLCCFRSLVQFALLSQPVFEGDETFECNASALFQCLTCVAYAGNIHGRIWTAYRLNPHPLAQVIRSTPV